MTFIAELRDGWHLFVDGRDFGPYSEKVGAESCQTQYEVFVRDAPDCHHGDKL